MQYRRDEGPGAAGGAQGPQQQAPGITIGGAGAVRSRFARRPSPEVRCCYAHARRTTVDCIAWQASSRLYMLM